MSRTSLAFPFLLLLLSCNSGSPTSPEACVDAADVFRTEAFYAETAEPEVVLSGRLTKRCPPPSPGGRDHCFRIDEVPVYSGNRDPVLDRYVGEEVTVRGKSVVVLGAGEIWPATICRRAR